MSVLWPLMLPIRWTGFSVSILQPLDHKFGVVGPKLHAGESVTWQEGELYVEWDLSVR